MNTLAKTVVTGEVNEESGLLDRQMNRRQASRMLLRSALSVAAIASALKAGDALAKRVDHPTTDVPVGPGTAAAGKIQRRLQAVVELEGGSPRWVIKGAGFSGDRIDLNAVEVKSGDVLWLLEPFQVIYGPSFSLRTNINPDKGLPVGHAYEITAWDNGTNQSSNTVLITTS